jgi:hypothetical protein
MGFASPGPSPKARTGKPNRPKRSTEDATGLSAQPRVHPITDTFASKTLPGFAERRAHTNNKSGFNTIPARPPAGRLAQRASTFPVSRGSGKEVRRSERSKDANSHGSGGTQRR